YQTEYDPADQKTNHGSFSLRMVARAPESKGAEHKSPSARGFECFGALRPIRGSVQPGYRQFRRQTREVLAPLAGCARMILPEADVRQWTRKCCTIYRRGIMATKKKRAPKTKAKTKATGKAHSQAPKGTFKASPASRFPGPVSSESI